MSSKLSPLPQKDSVMLPRIGLNSQTPNENNNPRPVVSPSLSDSKPETASSNPIPQSKTPGKKVVKNSRWPYFSPKKILRAALGHARVVSHSALAGVSFVTAITVVIISIFLLLSSNASAAPNSSSSPAAPAVSAVQPAKAEANQVSYSLPAAVQPSSNQGGDSTPTATPAANPNSVYEPPVTGQGGTCITGSVIDIYHNLIGYSLEITVTRKGGSVVKTIKSDTTGHFRVDGLEAGTYTVTVQVLDGWRPITLPSFDVVLSGSGGQCAEVRAKFELPGCLVVEKLNHDDTGHTVGIPNWNMTLINQQSGKVLKGSTDSDGKIYFPNMETGTWLVSEETREGWWPMQTTQSFDGYRWLSSVITSANQKVVVTQDTPQSWWSFPNPNPYGGQTIVSVTSAPFPQNNSYCQPIPFVNKQIKGSIMVRKEDPSGNPLANWNILLTRKDGTQPPQQRLTDMNGYACFDGLELGEWLVNEQLQSGWVQVSTPSNPINVTKRQDCSQAVVQKFVNTAAGCIDGYKINDLEEVLPGWEITASNTTTNVSHSAVTDANGYFRIENLPFGTWQIAETPQDGWEPVTPSAFPVNVDHQGPECKHVRFKNRTKYACVDVYKRDAFDGVGLPGWSFTLTPYYSSTALASGLTDGSGWKRFDKLTPGEYSITELGQAGWHAIGNDSYHVKLEASGTCAVVTFCNLQNNMGLPANQMCAPGVSAKASVEPTPIPPYNPPLQPGCAQSYTIRPGDTFFGIAAMFNVPIQNLAAANPNVEPRWIYPFAPLCIPYGGNG